MEGALIQIVIFGGLMGLGVLGFYREKAHIIDLEEREERMLLPTSNLATVPAATIVSEAILVTGSVVQAADYLKMFLFRFVNLFGGESQSLGRVMVRARREALLRAQQDAVDFGAIALINVRFETSTIGRKKGKNGLLATEVLCHATAVK